MAGEPSKGFSYGPTQGVMTGDGCGCGYDGRGLPKPECPVHGSEGVSSVVLSSDVFRATQSQTPMVQHRVSPEVLVERGGTNNVDSQELGKRKKRGGGGMPWTAMFKKQRVLDVPVHGNEGGVSTRVPLRPAVCEHEGEVGLPRTKLEDSIGVRSDEGVRAIWSQPESLITGIQPRTEVEGSIVVCSNEGVLTDWSQPMSAIPGRFIGPLLLDFGEGKVKPLCQSDGTYRTDHYQDIEHVESTRRNWNGGGCQQQPSLKRHLDGSVSDGVCKKKRAEFEQRQSVAPQGGEHAVSEMIGDAVIMPRIPFQGTSLRV